MRRAWLRGIHVRKKQDDRMPSCHPGLLNAVALRSQRTASNHTGVLGVFSCHSPKDPQRHKCNRTHTLPREASLSDCRQQSTQLDPSSRSQNGFRQGKRCFPAHQ
ncbi:hypothetical protein SKAU_G00428330 [Synaphobranchus kaupii]|uniref:Uncharacterized protein n=1 Tax=Synaphobranchus kaupii TaxID=118154 RepID=A0A9Q1E4P0_SYNKA|nr:hypothetical protein SKAU_G00428330 [Synaphobranchus kaupii]